MPRRRSTTPDREPDTDLAPEPADEPTPQRRAVPPFGTCRADVRTFELYRVTSLEDGREQHEHLTSPGGIGGTDRREWPIEELSPELLAPHGPGVYRARWYGRRDDGARTPLGMSQKVTRSAIGAAAAAPSRPEPTHVPQTIDLPSIVAAAEARAEARARAMLDFVVQQSAQKEKQQSDFFAAMMELQTRAHSQQMEALQRARSPVVAPASVSPELVKIQTELAVMRDRQRRGVSTDDEDEDEDPAMRLLSSPVIAEIARVFAAKFLETPTASNGSNGAATTATPPPNIEDATESDADDPA